MATRESSKRDILSLTDLNAEQVESLRNIDTKRKRIVEDTETSLNKYDETVEKLKSGKIKGEEARAELSKLEQAIVRKEQFEGEITDTARHLVGELAELGQFFGDATNYKGTIEILLSKIGATKLADGQRMRRVMNANVEQNLKNILDYGEHMVNRLSNIALDNAGAYKRIEGAQNETAETLKENQPLYEQWRTSREAFERDLKNLDEKIDKAEQGEYAVLQTERNTLKAKLDDAQIKEDNYFSLVKSCTEALPLQRQHLDSYKEMMNAVMQFRTKMEADINHVTQIYLSVPVAMQTVLSVKAASTYDKAMKYTTDKATDAVLSSVEGVLDEVSARRKRPMLEPDKVEQYRNRFHEASLEFAQEIELIKTDHSRADKKAG